MANIIDLGRTDGTSQRQLEAAPIILREYIKEALADGEVREATEVLQALFRYLRSDITGRNAHRILKDDPINLFKYFVADERLDSRWREISLGNMIAQLEAKRRSSAL